MSNYQTVPQTNHDEMNIIPATPQQAAQVTTYRDQMNRFRNNPTLCQKRSHDNDDSDFASEEEVVEETQV